MKQKKKTEKFPLGDFRSTYGPSPFELTAGQGMARASCTFRQRDLSAAIKAVLAAGEKVLRIEIGKSGTIVLFTDADAHAQAGPAFNEWDAK